MHEPTITVIGNVAVVPTLRTLASGTAVAGFRIANTPRRQDRGTGEWSDGETSWFGVTCWRSLAQHCAESLRKGDRVVVTGRLVTRSWRSETGEERTGLEIDAVAVGYDLTRTAAVPVRSVAPVVAPESAGGPASAAVSDAGSGPLADPSWGSGEDSPAEPGEAVPAAQPGEPRELAA